MTLWDMELTAAKILIVDDEPANVLLLQKLLRQQGCTAVTGTTDPHEALALYAREPQDLVLLDLRMPGLDGFAVMRALRDIAGDDCAPVLILTAQADQPTRVSALGSGARDFLTKPFDCLEALSRIRNMLEMRVLYNRLHRQKLALEETVHARTCEVRASRLEVVRHLGRAAEYRDNETGLHILRMSKISATLARRAGLPEAECELILNASPMHDIGKIGIPDAILLKPGKLDEHEWEVMRAHTVIGAEILSGHDSDLMKMARDIALAHHEKWDGSGYPYGIAGHDIPVAARITAVADVFDALTSIRPYKKAWPVADAVRELDKMAGTHLDPDLVEAFHDVLPETMAIMAQHAEPTQPHAEEVAGRPALGPAGARAVATLEQQ